MCNNCRSNDLHDEGRPDHTCKKWLLWYCLWYRKLDLCKGIIIKTAWISFLERNGLILQKESWTNYSSKEIPLFIDWYTRYYKWPIHSHKVPGKDTWNDLFAKGEGHYLLLVMFECYILHLGTGHKNMAYYKKLSGVWSGVWSGAWSGVWSGVKSGVDSGV